MKAQACNKNSFEHKVIRLAWKTRWFLCSFPKQGKGRVSPAGNFMVFLLTSECAVSQPTSCSVSSDSEHDFIDLFKNPSSKSYLKHKTYLLVTWKHCVSCCLVSWSPSQGPSYLTGLSQSRLMVSLDFPASKCESLLTQNSDFIFALVILIPYMI